MLEPEGVVGRELLGESCCAMGSDEEEVGEVEVGAAPLLRDKPAVDEAMLDLGEERRSEDGRKRKKKRRDSRSSC